MEQSVAVWGHGRHVGARGWENLVWGSPEEGKLGTLPMMILTALGVGPQHVRVLGVGTGASRTPGGRIEARCMQDCLVRNTHRLEEFDRIRTHPNWTATGRGEITRLIDRIALDTWSQNTAEEIEQAARIFREYGATQIFAVTCSSHAPRCVALQSQARAAGVIPPGQIWATVPDDMDFGGGDTLIIEPPHRGDDPALHAHPKAHQVLARFFRLSPEDRMTFLDEASVFFRRHLP